MREGYGKIEVFPTEEDVLNRIAALKAEGKKESEIYVISEKRKGSSAITDRSEVNYTHATGSMKDKFAVFFSDSSVEDPEDRVLKRFNLNKSERDKLIDDLMEGKILLYVGPIESGPTPVNPEETVRKGSAGRNNGAAGTAGVHDKERRNATNNKGHNKLEVYEKESEALARISELRGRGLPENNIYVFSDNPDDASKLTAETDVNYRSAKGSGSERFTSLFSSDAPEEKVIDHFVDLSEQEKENYAHDLKEGRILLYVDVLE